MNRWLWGAVLVGIIATLVVCYRLAQQSLVLGSLEGRWVYSYIEGFNPRTLRTWAIVFVVAGGLAVLPADVVRRREWWLVAIWLCVGTVAQIRLRELAPYSMGRMFASEGSNGFYTEVRKNPMSAVLRDFDRLRQTMSIHPRSNMPGKLLLVHALARISGDPETLSRLVLVLSNLGGLALYLLVRSFSGDPVTAMLSLALYLFVPAKLFFFPTLNTITPAILITCLLLWQYVLKTRFVIYSVALGVALFVLAFYEPLPFVTFIIFFGMALNAVARGEVTWPALVKHGVIAGAGFIAIYVATMALTGFDLLTAFRHLFAEADAFNAAASRPYGIWVWRNLIDFSIGVGLCQALLLVAVSAQVIRRRAGADRAHEPIVLFAGAVLATILMTDLVGVNRGEVLRLWVFLACLAQVPAAYACVRLNNRAATLAVVATTLLLGTIGTSMMGFAQP